MRAEIERRLAEAQTQREQYKQAFVDLERQAALVQKKYTETTLRIKVYEELLAAAEPIAADGGDGDGAAAC